MSAIVEYLKLIPKGLPHTPKIVESIVNTVKLTYGSLPEDEKEEIIRRRIICASCPFMSKNATTSKEFKDLTGYRYETHRSDDHCSFCGCGIKMRTSGMNNSCGIETWNKDHPKNKIDLKWGKHTKSV